MWAYYSREAKIVKKICHFPSKPHKDGMLTYILCQRFLYSKHPFALAFAPTFLGARVTPRDAVMALVDLLRRAGFDKSSDCILVTDSLWSYPNHILEFLELNWKFVLSAKEHTSAVPPQLRALA